METAKQKAIREAYGEENWKIVKDYVNKEGELSINKVKLISNLPESFEVLNHKAVRPKSLKGIEDNNGWIKIENGNIKDFQNEFCWVVMINGDLEKIYIHSSNHSFLLLNATHYQLIPKPKPPIY